jgi:hypothetical protein
LASDLSASDPEVRQRTEGLTSVQYASLDQQIGQTSIPNLPLQGPCHFGEKNASFIDRIGWIQNNAFEEFINMLKKLGGDYEKGIAKKWSRGNAAQQILDFAKYVSYLFTFRVDFSPSPSNSHPPPLMRTKETSTPGERLNFVVTAFYDPGSSQYVNCMKIALAGIGIMFEVPQSGPMEGGSLQIQGLEGFGKASDVDPIDTLFGAPTRSKGAIVEFINLPRPDRVKLKDGKVEFGIIGTPQEEKIPENYKQNNKKIARIKISPQFQEADIIKDLMAAIDNAKGILRSGVGAEMLTITAEMLMRTRLFSYDFVIPVMDWEKPGYSFDRVVLEEFGVVKTGTVSTKFKFEFVLEDGLVCFSKYGPQVIANTIITHYVNSVIVSSGSIGGTVYPIKSKTRMWIILVDLLSSKYSFPGEESSTRLKIESIWTERMSPDANFSLISKNNPISVALSPSDRCSEIIYDWLEDIDTVYHIPPELIHSLP